MIKNYSCRIYNSANLLILDTIIQAENEAQAEEEILKDYIIYKNDTLVIEEIVLYPY